MPFSDKPITHKQFTVTIAIMMVVSFSLAGLGITMSNAQRRETERKFCGVITLAVGEAGRRVLGYRENPPNTEAGQSQQHAAEVAYVRYQELSHRLGCSPS